MKQFEQVLLEYKQNGRPTTIVVGNSLSGLSSAFSLSLRGHNVIIFDKRGEYTRNQRIFLSKKLIKALYQLSDLPKFGITFSLPEKGFSLKLIYPDNFDPKTNDALILDLNFFQLLEQQHCAIPIKELQQYQLNRFKTMLADNCDFSYSVENQGHVKKKNFSLKGRVAFFCGPQYTVTGIDGKEQILKLNITDLDTVQTYEVPFDHFIAADGSKHEMADLLAQNSGYKIRLKSLPPPKHNAYGLCTLTLKNNTGQFARLPFRTIASPIKDRPVINPSLLNLLETFGWTQSYTPIVYLNTDDTTNECYITSEIPIEYLSLENTLQKKRLHDWFTTLAGSLLGIGPAEFMATEDKCTAYRVQSQCFEDNYITLGKKGKFISVGDAWLPANFLFGHGAESAISDGNVIYDCFNAEGEFTSINPLADHRAFRLNEYHNYTRQTEEHRTPELVNAWKQVDSTKNELKNYKQQLSALEREIKNYNLDNGNIQHYCFLQESKINIFQKITELFTQQASLYEYILRARRNIKDNDHYQQKNVMLDNSLQQARVDLIWLNKMYHQKRNAMWEKNWKVNHGENCQDMYAIQVYGTHKR